ncbi:phosphoadenosine phosphosulfate reductase family protein [Roseofilum reptotaenium CS-1145]|uniref:Phosphoadenosine phosphosulfate reductase n=1 Tax=Roseofilum reptotaenium AO1-A TaxID=1925591 RepID=A0A1L9QWV0_9CYAN|nr:phosphoadenosine phosphosulfate reductase family protein [Roseofilum reptotaenium]MDB9518512.1 phosphoadenosine phosphosulfate reductase family protein [Roseofilum reptotaenium CS-1145]OJJ27077.1 phosphoadenosine phosphosulfate reductase [Roseofilum reptotaenium AO1-A]
MSHKKVRHILGLSGGKDSTALAVLMQQQHPELEIEYFFCDTHKELPETYNYLDRIEARLGIKIHYLSAKRGFDHWLEIHDRLLPSPQRRWCTVMMKIKPLEKFIGDDETISYIGIRADENREGYISTKPNIKPVFPFKEQGLVKADILRILEDSGIGLPDYYRWRNRSGCFFCFFQRKYEWVMLAQEHPKRFAEAVKYEENHKDGRTYTWTEGETLSELWERKEEIIREHEEAMAKARAKEKEHAPNQPLSQVLDSVFEDESFCFAQALESVLDEQDDDLPCLACHS